MMSPFRDLRGLSFIHHMLTTANSFCLSFSDASHRLSVFRDFHFSLSNSVHGQQGLLIFAFEVQPRMTDTRNKFTLISWSKQRSLPAHLSSTPRIMADPLASETIVSFQRMSDTASQSGLSPRTGCNDIWLDKKDILHKLYIQDERSLKEVMGIMERQHDFIAS